MNRLTQYFQKFDRVAWMLIGGEFLESTGRYMVQPFLALYLNSKQVDLGVIGLILAAGPIATIIIGLLGGSFADRVGRRPLLLWSTVLASIALFGFGLTTSVTAFAILNFINTAARSFYRPANFAALADVTLPHQRTVNVIAMTVVMTFGELIAAAAIGIFVAKIAPAHLRGRYEAVANLRETGRAIFPAFAGYIMTGFGVPVLFSLIAVMLVIAAFLGKYADVQADRQLAMHQPLEMTSQV